MIVVFSWSDPETIWSSWHFFPPLSENTSNSRAIYLLGLHPCFHYFFPGRSIDVIPVHTPPSPPSWPYTQVDGLLLQPLPQGNDVAAAAAAKSLKSCPTLCNPVNCSLPGSSILGICQARVLEWGAIAFLVMMRINKFYAAGTNWPEASDRNYSSDWSCSWWCCW